MRRNDGVDDLAARVYDELRRVAARSLRGERAGHTLQATALVHEAYIRLSSQGDFEFRDAEHFRSIAARMIRRVLVDHARRRGAARRGGDRFRVTLAEDLSVTVRADVDLLALDEALLEYAERDPRAVRLVELRFFGGLTMAEAAREIGVSERVAAEDWAMARAWLRRRLDESRPGGS